MSLDFFHIFSFAQDPTLPPSSSLSSSNSFALQTGIVADEEKMAAVRGEIKHAWDMYKKYAWGEDLLQPIAKRGRQWMGKGCMIIDALDTLYISGLKQEYEDGIAWVENDLDFNKFRDDLPLFESVIRVLGGLLGAYALDPRPKVLERAKQVGDMLFSAIQASPSHFPHPTARWRHHGGSGPQIVLAEVGTLQMEYVYLSAATGDMKYADGVLRAFKYFYGTGRGLFGQNCNVQSGVCNGKLSVGGGSDSVYEYFAKMWLLSGKKVNKFHELWRRTVKELTGLMAKSSPSELIYFGDSYNGVNPTPTWGHLQCFIGGTYTLMAQYAGDDVSRKTEFEIGAGLGRTCHEMYKRSPTGLGASVINFSPGNDFTISSRDYVLRPEAIESWFYLYRHTKDEKYREWAWEAFLAIKKHCRVDGGYAGLRDVTQPGSYEDNQETFVLAETFKYLYCIFSTEKDCDLSKYVFNTEAHPFPILDPDEKPAYRQLYSQMR